MKVYELIGLLQECDQEAEVRIMCQPNYPFENSIAGVAVRSDFPNEDCDCDPQWDGKHDEGCESENDGAADGCSANDVFIVEGEQERYGNKAAWEAVRRS